MLDEHRRPGYGNLAKLKSSAYLKDPAGGDSWDAELYGLLVAASEWIDYWTGRIFFPFRAQFRVNGSGTIELPVPSPLNVLRIISVRSTMLDGSRGPVLDESEYSLYGFLPNTGFGEGAEIIVRSTGVWDRGFKNWRVFAYCGYRMSVSQAVTRISANVLDLDATEIVVAGDVNCQAGDTVIARKFANPDNVALVGDGSPEEVMLVRDVNGQTLTVSRHLGNTGRQNLRPPTGVNPNFDALVRLEYPPAIEAAACITAARWFTRAPDFEPFYVDTDLDTDVRLLLAPFRREGHQIV